MSSELLSKTEWHSCLGCQAECKERQKATSGAQGWGVLGCRTCCSTSPCSQAFLIAFTSDFLPRVYYEYVHNSSLHGYVNFTLAYAPSDFVLRSNTSCRWEPPSRPIWLLSSFAWAGICFALWPVSQKMF